MAAVERRIRVYPSLVQIVDGQQTFNIDIQLLYAIFAAHLKQNGLWSDIDYDALPDDVKAQFDEMDKDFAGYGSVTAIKTKRKWL